MPESVLAVRPGAARVVSFAVVLAVLPASLGAQRSATARDTVRADSSGVQPLPGVTVTVTRDARPLSRVPWAVGVVGERELRRGQPGVGLDEALTSIPGVYVANRYSFALDQRVTMRGFGTRANFGVRGVQVVLDGIPQTLPDGQSQLTNVELGLLSRAEVLRGPASSLYGNGAGGVLSFTTDIGATDAPSARVEGGSHGLLKWQARAGGTRGRVSGAVGVSRLEWEGFRPHSSADVRQLVLGGDVAVDASTVLQARAYLADMPDALNPGPLTAAEFDEDPDVASPNNVRRGADKVLRQGQLSLRLVRQAAERGDLELDASVFALSRDLENAIASPPPAPAAPENGTYITLDREAYGARMSASRALGASPMAPRLTVGVDWRWMRDMRENHRSTAGRPTTPDDTLLLSQEETVWALGPFAQLEWAPDDRLLLSAGGRWDRVRFAADDRFLSDGDASGARAIPAWSGHLGASYELTRAFTPYATVATAFETPTTVELQEGAASGGGFSADLGPQHAASVEVGARGAVAGDRLSYSAALFSARVTDAIVQYQEAGGRAFFRNAGAARHTGLELGMGARATDRVALDVAYTWSSYRFTDYRVERGDEVLVYDDNVLPGVPEHFLRLGLRTRPFAGATLDVDHVVSSAVWADDANTVRVDGWGPGITSARATWRTRVGGVALEPFAGVQNIAGRRYVSSVVVNGFGGRVREPGPGRSVYLGVGIGG
ncbi:MAG TPA: TonB-dependent receptor [Gemmatimonadales bacterium]